MISYYLPPTLHVLLRGNLVMYRIANEDFRIPTKFYAIRHECFDWHFIFVSRYFPQRSLRCSSRRVSKSVAATEPFDCISCVSVKPNVFSCNTHGVIQYVTISTRIRYRRTTVIHPPHPSHPRMRSYTYTVYCFYPFCFPRHCTRPRHRILFVSLDVSYKNRIIPTRQISVFRTPFADDQIKTVVIGD